jgi:hypothetical protein
MVTLYSYTNDLVVVNPSSDKRIFSNARIRRWYCSFIPFHASSSAFVPLRDSLGETAIGPRSADTSGFSQRSNIYRIKGFKFLHQYSLCHFYQTTTAPVLIDNAQYQAIIVILL